MDLHNQVYYNDFECTKINLKLFRLAYSAMTPSPTTTAGGGGGREHPTQVGLNLRRYTPTKIKKILRKLIRKKYIS